ncbi:MAG TPA: polyprenyl synthetase family protein [Candidatus Hydrogenedentes bacterium]|nr:polyprenyl synthetase family protein [Candidatus Hydrogenedentota bacterium]HOS03099.1 polyprenyl synthetase family protein [Candidatus Hydrogenedentota bacterium]
MSVSRFLNEKAEKTERALRDQFATWRGVPEALREAMAYSLFAGGKRLRPALVLGACEIVRGDDAPALPAACAIEMIHTYSLIHDDLPCMDDDDLRRGRPTLHKVHGDAIAVLAGDGLLTMAFDVAAQTGNLAVVRELAQAAGVTGMVGGQALDMQSENQQLTLDELRHLHACKTGALIRVAARMGAILGGASQTQLEVLTAYGEAIGLAFQIADDVLDVVGDEANLGKRTGADDARNKSTYPALLGLDGARQRAKVAIDQAIEALRAFGEEANPLRDLARFVVERNA